MKLKLITLGLLLINLNFFAQQTNNNEYNYFIDVDLTKNLADYGFSKVGLKEVLTPIDLGNFKTGEDHFLSDINFDKQVAGVTKDGTITLVFLEKQFESESNNKEDVYKFYSLIVDRFRAKYGLSTNSNKNFTEWMAPEYQISINIQNDSSVLITYNSLLSRKLEEEGMNSEESNFTSNTENEKIENAKILEGYYNDFLQRFKQVNIRSFARLNGDVMEIYFERDQKITPSYEDADLQKEIKKLELSSFRDLIEDAISSSFKTDKDIGILKNTHLNKFKFIQDIYYNDGTQSHLTQILYIYELLKLQTPLRKKEILEILK
jgi:hypothetical protein